MKSKKIFIIVMTIAMIFMLTLPVFAANKSTGTTTMSPSEFGSSINVSDNAKTSITGFGGQIVGTLQVVGTVIAVLILVVLGIKYMMGSAEEKAEYKKTMMPYLVGALLIFAAVTIANMVYNFTSTLQ